MKFKIVTDSSSDLLTLNGIDFASAPLKIITSEKEYVDNSALDVEEMVTDLKNYKGRSSTACPSVADFLDAFGNAQYVFCLTITATLSGSYNAACLAKREYEEMYPDRHVFVLNTLTTGPEMVLQAEKVIDWIREGLSFDNICEKLTAYMEHTGLLFILESMTNLANNGRVSHAVAKIAGILGIRIVGKASNEGTLEITDKARGTDKALAAIVKNMASTGFKGGIVRIHHCQNLASAEALGKLIKEKFSSAVIKIQETRALCSFYAESGGLLVGYEGALK